MEGLDVDCVKYLVKYLGGENTISLGRVNKSWNLKLLSPQFDNIIWKFLCLHQFNFNSKIENQNLPNDFRRKWCRLRDWRKCGKFLEEEVTIPTQQSRGVIQFLHGFGFGIKIANKKISYSWPVYWSGSLMRFYLRGHRLGDSLLEDIQKVSCLLNEGLIDTSESLQSQFWTFLRLFQPGTYLLRLQYSPEPTKFYPPFADFRYLKGGYNYCSSACFEEGRPDRGVDPSKAIRTDYYDYNGFNKYHIIFTQSMGTLNRERVDHYKRIIQKRIFPIILVLHVNTDDFYILDGHHKYQAYKELKDFNPVMLTIQPKIFLDQSSSLPLQWSGPYVKYSRECVNWCKGVGIFEGEAEELEFVNELHPESLEIWKNHLKSPLKVFEKIGYSESAQPVVFKLMYLPPPPKQLEEEIEEYIEPEEEEEDNDEENDQDE